MRFWQCLSPGFSGAGKHAVSAVRANASHGHGLCVYVQARRLRAGWRTSPTPTLGACPGPAAREQGCSAAAPLWRAEARAEANRRFFEGEQAFLSSEAAAPNRPSLSQVRDPGTHRRKLPPGPWQPRGTRARTGSPQGPSPRPGTDHKPASRCSSALLAPSPLSRARRGARESENLNPNRLSCRWLNKCPNDFPVFLCSSDYHSKTSEKCLCEWKPVARAKNTVLLLLEQPGGRHATSGQGSGGLCGRWLSTAAGWKACLLSAAWCRD